MFRKVVGVACVAASLFAFGCSGEEETPPPDPNAPLVEISLALEGDDAALAVGKVMQLRTLGVRESGWRGPIAEGVQFTSSNEVIATVDETGLVRALREGPVTFTARVGELEAVLEANVACSYPQFSPELVYGRVMPALSWPAKRENGTAAGESFVFDLREVRCSVEWADTKTITFVLSAGWCTPCTLYAQRLEQEIDELRQLGMEVVIIEVEDYDTLPADLNFAWGHLNRITGTVPGIVAGDADTMPQPRFLAETSILRAFPSVFVVRTSDMRIIADQNRTDRYLPLDQIAANPDADWSSPGYPAFENNCAEGQEEASEPNDTPDLAQPIGPGSYEGGICADGPDIYLVEIDGPWRLTLEFDHDVGDLDVFVWDERLNQPAQFDGQVIGSATQTGVETFEHRGRAYVAVLPFQHASAPYVLTLEAL